MRALIRFAVLLLSAGLVPASGTSGLQRGSVSGSIVLKADGAKSVRDAIVSLTNLDTREVQSTFSDDSGRFAFGDLSSGRYEVKASKPAFLPTAYGARRIGGVGIPVEIAAGSPREDIVIRLPRGSVIAGCVRDEQGEPVANAQIQVFPLLGGSAGLQLGAAPSGTALTNDTGCYRAFGLAPGAYIVKAIFVSPAKFANPPLRQVTTEELAVAREPGKLPATDPSKDAALSSVGYTPSFHPSGSTEATAAPVRVSEEQVIESINIAARPERVFRVEVASVVPSDVVASDYVITVALLKDSERGAAGFLRKAVANGEVAAIDGVPAGDYRVHVFASARGSATELLWGDAIVAVGAQPTTKLTCPLKRAIPITGVADFLDRSDASKPRITVALESLSRDALLAAALSTTVDAGQEFRFLVPPGRYVVKAHAPGLPFAGLISVKVVDQDATDLSFDVLPTDAGKRVEVGVAARAAGLGGKVLDSGRDRSDLRVVVFSPDSKFWRPGSSHIQSTRVGTDGGYSLLGLVPGVYAITVVRDSEIELNRWFDGDVLRGWMSQKPTQVTLELGRIAQVDLRIGSSVEPRTSKQ
jgi:hypothetical protein